MMALPGIQMVVLLTHSMIAWYAAVANINLLLGNPVVRHALREHFEPMITTTIACLAQKIMSLIIIMTVNCVQVVNIKHKVQAQAVFHALPVLLGQVMKMALLLGMVDQITILQIIGMIVWYVHLANTNIKLRKKVV